MDGFSPTFFLQLIIALGSGFGAFYAMKADLKTMFRQLDEEKRLREAHSAEDDLSFQNIRTEIGEVSNRVSVMEGQLKGSQR
jgi:Tfp pilus assembly protein PilO